VPFAKRGRLTDEYLATLQQAWGAQSSIPLCVGGDSAAAIRRSVKFGAAWHPLCVTLSFPGCAALACERLLLGAAPGHVACRLLCCGLRVWWVCCNGLGPGGAPHQEESSFAISGLVWRCRPGAGWPQGLSGEASVTAKAIPRHAGTLEWQCSGPGPGEGRVLGVHNPGADLRLAQERAPADPLPGPVAITERAVLGDQLRRPTAWCEMPACISLHDDPAAVGEADIRSRALAAGWRHDAVGRLVCPYCQQRNPGLWVAYPLARQHPPSAEVSRQHPAHARPGRIDAVWTTLSAWQRQVRNDLAHRTRWPHLRAAVAAAGNGRNIPKSAPPADPATSARGRRRRGPAGPGRRLARRAAATSPASRGGDHRRQQGQPRPTPRP
jgi:hypothetical protein